MLVSGPETFLYFNGGPHQLFSELAVPALGVPTKTRWVMDMNTGMLTGAGTSQWASLDRAGGGGGGGNSLRPYSQQRPMRTNLS